MTQPPPTTPQRPPAAAPQVVSWDKLQEDLRTWRWLYLAGRLHKPVRASSGAAAAEVEAAHHANLLGAARTSLLLLPEDFSRYDFYMTIAGLSYAGDFRMQFGENPDKVLEFRNFTHQIHDSTITKHIQTRR